MNITPKFATPLDRTKVEQLMQPALIRVIDNVRKQLDASDWQGKYEEALIWPADTNETQKQAYATLQKRLHGVPPEEHDRVAALMAQLPQPSPLYTLRLSKSDFPDQTVDIWQLCYRVCAQLEESSLEKSSLEDRVIAADISLLDEDGEVDWRSLDDKTRALIEDIFKHLPT